MGIAPELGYRVGKIYEWLGLSVGVVEASNPMEEKYASFRTDITFITATELCFTYLRDQTIFPPEPIVRSLS